jgi:hypothetical protein
MKRIALATVVMFVTGLTAATAANWWETPEYVEADHVYTMDYVTPHVQWAKPLPGGKVRALFFISSKSSPPREIAEMCQRGDIEPSIVYYDRSGKTVQDGQVGMERAVRVIKQGPDVFVFANCVFESLSGEAQGRRRSRSPTSARSNCRTTCRSGCPSRRCRWAGRWRRHWVLRTRRTQIWPRLS